MGPYLRRERDKREYFRLFSQAGYGGSIARTALLLTARKLSAETDLPGRGDTLANLSGDTVVVFTNSVANNTERHFGAVRGHSALLYRELQRITRKTYLPQPCSSPFVAVHVRLGDFTRPAGGYATLEKNSRLPIEWYASVVKRLQASARGKIPVVVFSDGDDEELRPLLSLASVTRAPRQESITDMLQIAQAGLLVSSASGFSMWGSFLGQVPRLCFPGTMLTPILDAGQNEIELDFDTALPANFQALAMGIAEKAY